MVWILAGNREMKFTCHWNTLALWSFTEDVSSFTVFKFYQHVHSETGSWLALISFLFSDWCFFKFYYCFKELECLPYEHLMLETSFWSTVEKLLLRRREKKGCRMALAKASYICLSMNANICGMQTMLISLTVLWPKFETIIFYNLYSWLNFYPGTQNSYKFTMKFC